MSEFATCKYCGQEMNGAHGCDGLVYFDCHGRKYDPVKAGGIWEIMLRLVGGVLTVTHHTVNPTIPAVIGNCAPFAAVSC